jgi:hypothetical protein
MVDHTPIGYDGFGAPLYAYQLPPIVDFGVVNVRPSELDQFDEEAVLEAAKKSAP